MSGAREPVDGRTEDRRPEVILARDGRSHRSARIRLGSHALEHVADLVESTISWCAVARPHATPALRFVVVCRTGAGCRIDPENFMNDYRWIGLPLDPFLLRGGTGSQPTLRGPQDLGGGTVFSALPFTSKFLNRHGLATRTVLYLRDRGEVTAVIALDRELGQPDLERHERVALIRLAPLLGQALSCGSHLDLTDPKAGELPLPVPGNLEILTARETQISRMVARGLNNDEIAQELTLSSGTIKVHLGHIYGKAGVSSRAELIGLLLGRNGRDGDGARTVGSKGHRDLTAADTGPEPAAGEEAGDPFAEPE